VTVGHRKNRKKERRLETQGRERWRRQPQVTEDEFIAPEPMSLLEIAGLRGGGGTFGIRTEAPKACGSCRQFVEDHDFGRGTCLHIASGILNPYSDTPACEYFERTKSASRR
jgi:hypothetical protein